MAVADESKTKQEEKKNVKGKPVENKEEDLSEEDQALKEALEANVAAAKSSDVTVQKEALERIR